MYIEKPKKYRYWIVHLPNDLAEGATFKPGELHLTIIPWFAVDIEDKEVLDGFHKKFSGGQSFKMAVGKKTVFHFKKRLTVNLFQPSTEIIKLHSEALKLFEELGARWAVKTPNVAENFIPHIRGVNQGEKLEINHLSLVRANRREDGEREVAARVELK